MFLFGWLNVMGDAYRNGLLDGMSIAVLLHFIRAFFGWERKCLYFREEMAHLIRKMRDGRDRPEDLERFHGRVIRCWCLAPAVRSRLLDLLENVQSFDGRVRSQTVSGQRRDAVAQFTDYAGTLGGSAWGMFRRMPVRAVLTALLHAEWFGRE